MARVRRSTAGRGGAGWLLALAALLGALLVLVLVLREEGGAPRVADAGDAVATPRPRGPELASGADVATRTELVRGALADAIEARPGVRLVGSGRLEGRVVERGSPAPGPGAGGPGVAGARVELFTLPPTGKDMLARVYRMAKFAPNWPRKLEPVATVESGPDGVFAFHGVRVGTYFLEARGARSTPDQAVLARVDSDGAGGPIDVYVRPGGRVVGTVFGPGSDAPVRGARVSLYAGMTTVLTAMRTGDFRIFDARTDGDGSFAIAGVPPGDGYFVSASGAGLALTHAGPLSVVAGADTPVEIHGLAGATIRGRVLAHRPGTDGEEQTTPVAGAHVGALSRGLRDMGFAAEVLADTHAVTGADGWYVMRGVPPGEIDVGAAAPGHLPAKSAPVLAASGVTVEAEPIVLETGPLVTLRFRDAAGAPVPDVQMSWFVTAFEEISWEPTFTPLLLQAVEGFEFPVSDAEGIAVAGPFPGRPPHTLFCWRTGYELEEVSWNPARDGDTLDVVMSSGGAAEGIVMDLERAEPVTRFQIRSGRILDWEPEGPTTVNPFSGGRWIEDESGRFRLDALGGWDAFVTFSAPGYLPEEVAISVAPGETTRGIIVKMRRGGTVRGRVVDGAGEPIAGAQVAAMDESGRPLLGGRLREPRSSAGSAQEWVGQEIALGSMEVFSGLGVLGAGFVVSDEEGAYELSGLPAGRVAVHASHRDHADGRSAVLAVAAGDPLEDVDVVLTRGGGIHGTVRDRFGAPVPDAFLLAVSTELMASTDPSARWLHQAATGAQGDYRLEHLAAGGYLLACMRGDAELNLASFLGTLNFDLVTVPPDAMVRHDLVDSSAAAVRVFGVVREEGRPVGGGGILAFGFEGENVLGLDVKVAHVTADGSYEFTGLAPGDTTFSYQATGPPVRMEVEIPDVPEHRLDLALPSGRVEGVVVDAVTGRPVQGAEAVLLRDDVPPAGGLIGSLVQREGRAARDWTNRDGRFAFPRLQAGTYELKVGPPRWGAQRGTWAPAEPRSIEVVERAPALELEVRLTPALVLTGRVVEGAAGAGSPVPGARVYAFSHDGGEVRPTAARAGADGAFTLYGLAPGRYDVSAAADGYADAPPREFEVGGAQAPEELLLELTRGVEVRVLVRDERGQPVQGATGRLVPLTASRGAPEPRLDHSIEGIFRGEGVSSPAGLLRLGHHAPGRYRLEVGRGTLRAEREPVVVEEGTPLELEVELD